MAAPHLLSAAAALERALTGTFPASEWVVTVREPGDEGHRLTDAPIVAGSNDSPDEAA